MESGCIARHYDIRRTAGLFGVITDKLDAPSVLNAEGQSDYLGSVKVRGWGQAFCTDVWFVSLDIFLLCATRFVDLEYKNKVMYTLFKEKKNYF